MLTLSLREKNEVSRPIYVFNLFDHHYQLDIMLVYHHMHNQKKLMNLSLNEPILTLFGKIWAETLFFVNQPTSLFSTHWRLHAKKKRICATYKFSVRLQHNSCRYLRIPLPLECVQIMLIFPSECLYAFHASILQGQLLNQLLVVVLNSFRVLDMGNFLQRYRIHV